MYKIQMPKKDWVAQAATAGGFYVRVLPVEFTAEDGDVMVESVEFKLDHKPTKKETAELEAKWLTACKRWKKSDISDYAKSPAVKAFSIGGVSGWLNSEQRVSIRRSVADKVAAGRESVTVYLAGKGFTMSPAKAEEILAAVEVYASDCYDVTENHKAAVEALTDSASVEAYDYASGYPNQLAFEL